MSRMGIATTTTMETTTNVHYSPNIAAEFHFGSARILCQRSQSSIFAWHTI